MDETAGDCIQNPLHLKRMPILLPPEETIVTSPDIYEEAAEIMWRADEFVPPDQNLKPPKFKTRYGFSIRVWTGIAATTRSLAATAALSLVATSVSTAVINARRKVKLKSCVDDCTGIIARARITLELGYASNRALETDSNEKRHTRKFYSRS